MDIEYESEPLDILSFFDDSGQPMFNIAEYLDEKDLDAIASRAHDQYEEDKASLDGKIRQADKILEMVEGDFNKKNYPFSGASNVNIPIILAAANRFCAYMMPAIVTGDKVIKCKVFGRDTAQQIDPQTGQPVTVSLGKREKADRLTIDLNYQLLVEDENWEDDTDKILRQMPILGGFWRKRYYNPLTRINESMVFSQYEVVVNKSCSSLSRAPAISYPFTLYEFELERKISSGQYIDQEYRSEKFTDIQREYDFVEQIRYEDLDQDGLSEPYIVTYETETKKIARIQPAYLAEDIQYDFNTRKIIYIKREECYVYYPFMPDPIGGFYGWGLGAILLHSNKAINGIMNQLLDAGHLANTQGGFIGGGMRLPSGVMRFDTPGTWKQLSTDGPTIAQNIVPLQFKEPSMVLFQLLGLMIDYAKDIANMRDVLSGEIAANAPATTTLAMIEQGMMEFKDIFKRIHRSLRKEAKILFRQSRLYRTETQYRDVLDDPQASIDDYNDKSMDVRPETDPTIITNMQKAAKIQFLMQYQGDPFVNQLEIRERVFENMNFDDIDSLLDVPPPPEPQPDPMQQQLMQLNLQNAMLQNKKLMTDIQETEADIMVAADKVRNEKMKTKADVAEKIAQAAEQLSLAEDRRPGEQVPQLISRLQQIVEEINRLEPEEQERVNEQIRTNRTGMAGMAGQSNDAGAF